MLNKIRIFYWLIIKQYYLHLLISFIFFLKKKSFKKINDKENLSYNEAKKICHKLFIKKKEFMTIF